MLQYSVILSIVLCVSVLSAPLESSGSEESSSTHIQKIKRNDDGQLTRPSPINPNIPGDPKPEEHISVVDDKNQSTTTTEESDDNRPPSIHAYEKPSSSEPNQSDEKRALDNGQKPAEIIQSLLPITLGEPAIQQLSNNRHITKRDTAEEPTSKTSSELSNASSEPSKPSSEPSKETKNPIPITLGQPTIAQAPPGYKHEKRSINDNGQTSKFETSHHIPAHVQLEQKHEAIDNPAVHEPSEKKDVKKEVSGITLKNPTIATPAILHQEIPIAGKNVESNTRSLSENSHPEPSKELVSPRNADDDHKVQYVHPVPVDQIIKHSQAAPEIHASHHSTDASVDVDSHDHIEHISPSALIKSK